MATHVQRDLSVKYIKNKLNRYERMLIRRAFNLISSKKNGKENEQERNLINKKNCCDAV